MSASIYYQKISKSNKTLPTWAPSNFIDTMERAFGHFPVELDVSHLPTLRGMLAAMREREADSINMLIEAIGEENRIRVWAEY